MKNRVVLRAGWRALANGWALCDLCAEPCLIGEGESGRCFIRECRNGQLVVRAYGRTRGYCAIGDEPLPEPTEDLMGRSSKRSWIGTFDKSDVTQARRTRCGPRRKPRSSLDKGPERAMPELEIGRVNDYFARIGVAGMELTGDLALGDTIRIRGHTTDLTQDVGSMQIEHEAVDDASAGASVGVKIDGRCRTGDAVYKVID